MEAGPILPAIVPDGPVGPPLLQFHSVLPPLPRSVAFPCLADLPEKRQAKFTDKDRQPRIRLFCFYGVADNFIEWLPFALEAPSWVEVAVYECKAHGLREDEPWDSSMEERLEDLWEHLRPTLVEHARDGAVEGAPVAFMCHSSGAQLVTLVAQRMRETLHLEPAAVFIADRAPPNVKAISDAGYKMLCEDHTQFFAHFNPTVLAYYNKGNPVSDAMYERWRRGMHLTQEHSVEEKYHVFACPIFVFIACAVFELDKHCARGAKGPLSEEVRESCRKRMLVVQSVKGSQADWDLHQYSYWKRWTTAKAEVQRIQCDHRACRFHPTVQESIWGELARCSGVGTAS